MIISLLKKSKFKGGQYQTVINDIATEEYEGKEYLVYYLTVETSTGLVEQKCSFFINENKRSPFYLFKERLVAIYGDGFDTDSHIGSKVIATFEINKDAVGNEYCNLVGYQPYEEEISKPAQEPIVVEDEELSITDQMVSYY